LHEKNRNSVKYNIVHYNVNNKKTYSEPQINTPCISVFSVVNFIFILFHHGLHGTHGNFHGF